MAPKPKKLKETYKHIQGAVGVSLFFRPALSAAFNVNMHTNQLA